VDYRQKAMEQVQAYYSPLGDQTAQAMTQAFQSIAEAHDDDPVLHIEQREIKAVRKAGGVAWFDFKTLCGGPRSQNDYLEIASLFHTVLLSGVPYMPPKMASEARRFTWLVDVFYDHKVKLIIAADVPAEQLYTEGPMANEFHRTVSRIIEMQSKEYLEAPRRIVDTSLT
jgi:cell division protein ZapE